MFAIVYFVFAWLIGGVDIKESFSTKYLKGNKIDSQIISTTFFDIETPDNWIHVFSGYGIEANPYGLFITPDGLIDYEVGYYGGVYEEVDSISVFENQIDTVNNIMICTGISENKKEYGVSFYGIEDGQRLVLYMSDEVKENHDELMDGVLNFKFNYFNTPLISLPCSQIVILDFKQL
jgi:hypothetical protein